MLNILWLSMMLVAVFFGIINGKIPDVVKAVTDSAQHAVEIAIGLAGIFCLWMGLMKILEMSGLQKIIAKLLSPALRFLYPEVPKDHPAIAAISLNMTANILGLSNAATPLGLRAMAELETLNVHPGIASNSMCMLLAINTSSVQLLPATAIAYLAAAGAHQPTQIILSSLLATTCSTVVAIILAKWLPHWRCFKISEKIMETNS